MVLAELTSSRFHDLIGKELDPELFPTPAAKHLIMAAHIVALGGNGCSSPIVAVQQLMALHDEGKLKIEEVNEADEYLDVCDTKDLEDMDALISALADVIKKVQTHQAVSDSLLKAGKSANAAQEIANTFQKVADIGKKRMTTGVSLPTTVDGIKAMLSRRLVNSMPTGIEELDNAIGGGLSKKALGAVVAPSGAGKSFFLCHLTVEAMLQKENVAYLSLELSEDQVMERIMANLVNMSIDEIIRDPKKAAERWEMLKPDIGEVRVIHETPRATTPRHFRTWLSELDDMGLHCRMMVCDFADKMVSAIGTHRTGYEDAGVVYDALRDLAFERDGWGWTASQAKGEAYGKKKVGATHFADSINKLRSLDLAVGLARTEQDEENEQVRFSVPKRREGEGHYETIGPIDWDPARGRISYVTGRIYPWEKK